MLRTLDLRGHRRGEPLDLPRPDIAEDEPVAQVGAILAEVRHRGDAALRELTKRFDGVEIDELRVPEDEIEPPWRLFRRDLLAALASGARRDRGASIATARPLQAVYERGGVVVTHLELPVDRVGVYAPGGRAKYPSSVLMTVVPAKVAGVGAIVCCVPPGPDGRRRPSSPRRGGDRRGRRDLPDRRRPGDRRDGVRDRVDRQGRRHRRPGHQVGHHSPSARSRGVVGVPSALAGPSEVVVVADGYAPAEWAAIDVVVQAEHGPDGFAWLITWSEEVADRGRRG